MSWDPSGDYALFDGAESVSYQPIGAAAFMVSGVLREQQATGQASAGAQLGLQPTDAPFNLPGPNMNGRSPGPGDSFVDSDGRGWTVMSVAFDALINQYRVVARRQRN